MDSKEQRQTTRLYLQQIERLDTIASIIREELQHRREAQRILDELGAGQLPRVTYAARLQKAIDQRGRIINQIKQLDNHVLQHYLIAYYVERKDQLKISDELFYSESHGRRLHGVALDAFYKMHLDNAAPHQQQGRKQPK